jgi:site-specific recombinase XerD
MSKNNKSGFAYHLSRFLSVYLPGQRNVSENTILSYKDTFKLILIFAKDEKKLASNQLSISDLSRSFFEDFILWLKVCRKCSVSTCNQRLGAIHAFFIYLQYEMPEAAAQCQEVLAIRTAKAPEGQFNYLTVEGIALLLAQPDLSTKTGRRDAALLSLLYDSGARVQEIVDLTVGDVRFISPATVKLTGKGKKTRIIPLLSGPEKLIKAYMKDYGLEQVSGTHPLFCNRSGVKFTRAGIAYTLKKYADMARKKSPNLIPVTVTPHCIRHSKAMHLLQADVNLIYIRDLLGHSDVKTTEIYARADTTLKRQALEKASPKLQQLQYPTWTDDDALMDWLNSFGKR